MTTPEDFSKPKLMIAQALFRGMTDLLDEAVAMYATDRDAAFAKCLEALELLGTVDGSVL